MNIFFQGFITLYLIFAQKKIRKNSDFIEFIRISKKNINFFLLYFIFAQLKVVFRFFIVVFAYIFVLLL